MHAGQVILFIPYYLKFVKMRILILNWRDIKNPQAGGAEVLTQEMAKRWVAWGHEVIQFSAMFAGAKREEVIGGVEIIRGGSSQVRSLGIPVHLSAFWWYLKYGKGKFDVVIDEIHGLPFFTPFYVQEKKVALICEVAKEIWDLAFSFPFNKIGRFIENHYFRFYKEIPFLTISPSTKEDLMKMGIKEENITVLPMGIIPPKNLKKYLKEKNPTLIFVGRLSKAKGIEEAIKVIYLLKKQHLKVKLWILGQKNGEYYQKLENLVKKLNLEKYIKFFGFVSQEKKFELMGRAHLLLNSSIREGFGLTIPEAGFVGTPAIVYNVAGLKDAVKQGINGLVVEVAPKAMTEAVLDLFSNKGKYQKIQQGAIKEAKKYHWEKTAKTALSVLEKNLQT